MIIIAGTISFDPAKLDTFTAAFEPMRAATLKEDGCLEYDFTLSRHDPGTVFFFEKWASDDALASHMQSAHMGAFGAVMGECGVKGVDVRKYSGATEGPLL